MISFDQGLALLERYGINQQRIAHSRGVAAFAHGMAARIAACHPELKIDPEKVRLAGLLHDIGRSRTGDHEINSVLILREERLHELAAIVMHGTLYEASQLRGRPDPQFLPESVENKIVAYADARFRLGPVTLDQRFAEIRIRRAGEHEKLAALDRARERFSRMEQELADLAAYPPELLAPV